MRAAGPGWRMPLRSLAVALAGLGFASAGLGQPAAAGGSERLEPCFACHGPKGVSALPLTPSLAGQPSFYAITQLFLFREGRRNNEAMNAVAKGMSDADLRAYSDLIGALAPPSPPPPPAAGTPPNDAVRSAALAEQYRCASCHGNDYAGGKQVPRLAGQREDYLAKALTEFRAGTRIGYTSAMVEALAGMSADDLALLARYLATFAPKAP